MLNPDFKDMLSALNEAEAKYVIVGAYALAHHGLPRATGDIDIFVEPSSENAPKVMEALRRFGAPLGEVSESDFATADVVFQIGVPPRRIDLMTSIDAVEFEAAFGSARTASVDGVPLRILSRQHLILNKRATGRLKDLADIEWLEKHGE